MIDFRHGDFRTALIDVCDVDLILTDPPYPREFLPLWDDLAAWAATSLRPGGLLAAYSGQSYLPMVYHMLASRLEYVWTAALPTGGSSQIVWRNGITKIPFNVRTKWKPVLVFAAMGGERGFSIPTDLFPGSKKTAEHHPWEQHIDPALKMVEALSKPDDLVCDPFLGSGTFGIAAMRAGRRFVGAEIEREAYDTALDRLAMEGV